MTDQEKAFEKLSKLKVGALFMEMGTGKTKVALDLIASKKEKVDYILWIIVDGYHRYTTMLLHKDIYEREDGCIPVSVIDKPLEDRMASTIRHNRARGEHSIELMTNIVAELTESGMSDAWIMKNIGMDAEELLRLKQLSGLQELFKDKDFSKSWE